MPETILSNHLVNAVDACIAKAKLAQQVEHAGLAGAIREVFLRELIQPLLPSGFKAATGKIIDRRGSLSAQTDIVIYNRARFSPLLFDEQTGVFPIDSVQYSIEVKSTVNATELRDAIRKGQALQALAGPRVVHCLFGFTTDLASGDSDLLRVRDYQSESAHPPVQVYCTVGSGYTYWTGKEWSTHKAVDRRAEVVGLLVGIMNTLVNINFLTSQVQPGHYLAWWGDAP